MRFARALFRLLYFVGFAVAFIGRAQLHRWWYRTESTQWALDFRRRWVRRYLLPVLGIRLRLVGRPPQMTCLFVGNHRSYIDPVLVCAEVLGFPLSKAEVRRWPLIGKGIQLTGILFVQRESTHSRKEAIEAIADRLRQGYSVILFPEGTTHANARTRPFRPGAFKTAVEEGVPIAPVAIDYRDASAYWLDNDTFLAHFLRCFGAPHIDAALHFGPPIQATDALEALTSAQQWIDEQLRLIRQNFSST